MVQALQRMSTSRLGRIRKWSLYFAIKYIDADSVSTIGHVRQKGERCGCVWIV